MKKLVKLLSIIPLLFVMMLIVTSCENEHQHSYAMKSNETKHWKECKCGEKSEEGSHSFGNWNTTNEPTVSTTGTKERECSICQYEETETIPVLKHDTHSYTTTKSNETKHWKECECGEKSEEEGHTFGDWTTIKEATSTTTGLKERECNACHYKENEIIPASSHTHSYTTTKYNETKHWKECSCGEKSEEENHTLGNWETVKEASYTELGQKKRVCSKCEYQETEDIPVLEHTHNYSTEWIIDKEATCAEAGSKSHHCLDCDEKIDITYINPLGHSFSNNWNYDENYHYQRAICEHIEEQNNREKHYFVGGVCEICSYKEGTNELAYIYSSDGKGYAVEGIGKVTESNIVIPSIYNGYFVTEISSSCFKNNKTIKSIVIPNSVTSIGYQAFYGCSNLTSITIPNSVTSIGDEAFWLCGSLRYNEYDNALYLGNSENPYLWLVKAKNTEITGCEIHRNTKYICGSAFRSCYNVKDITIPDSIISIGFGGVSCHQYNEYDNALYLGNSENPYLWLVAVKDKKRTSFEIHRNTKHIYHYAFSGCVNLTNIVIPDGVISIGDDVFFGCDSLTSITIPDSVTSISSSSCSSLMNVYYKGTIEDWCKIKFKRPFLDSSLNPMYYASHFYLRNSNNEWEEVKSIEIPNGITEIGQYQFYRFNNVESITIPDSVTSIGQEAFHKCISLVNITLPFVGSNVNGTINTYFGYIFGARDYFYNSSYVPDSLKEVIITGDTSIGDYAFYKCSSLTSITFLNSVTSIGHNAFLRCYSLQYNEYDNALYLGNSENPYLYLVKAKDTEITSCEIHESTEYIYLSAFDNCSSLQYNEYDNALYLGNSENPYLWLVKAKDTEITSCEIHRNTKYICESAFDGCSSLISITLPFIGGSLNGITNTHFGYIFGVEISSDNSNHISSNVNEVIITGGTYIGYNAFNGCSNLTSIIIPKSVTIIGEYAFYNCDSLMNVYYNGTSSQWDDIIISSYNYSLTSSTIYYYSETEPTTSGNYWHYVDGVPTKW